MIEKNHVGDSEKEKRTTKREIAAQYRGNIRTITKFMKRKILPFEKEGRRVRFDVAACDDTMKKYRSKTLFDRVLVCLPNCTQCKLISKRWLAFRGSTSRASRQN